MADLPDPPTPKFATPLFEEEVVVTPATAGAPAGSVPRAAFAALLIGNAVLACGPWLVRMADVGPVASGFWRLALAVPFLLLIAGTADGPKRAARISPVLLWLLAAAGVMFALDLAAWHAGILRTKLANAALFGNISSFFFAAYGFLMARAWPSRRQAGAIALALAGIALLLGRSYELSAEHLTGDLLCMAAGLAYAGYMILIERVRGRTGTWTMLATATIAAAIVLLPMALMIDGEVWPHRWGPLVAVAIGSQVIGQGLLVYTIRVLPPVVVGLGQLSQPMVAAAIGWIAFREHLAAPDIAGAVAILVALMLVRRA